MSWLCCVYNGRKIEVFIIVVLFFAIITIVAQTAQWSIIIYSVLYEDIVINGIFAGLRSSGCTSNHCCWRWCRIIPGINCIKVSPPSRYIFALGSMLSINSGKGKGRFVWIDYWAYPVSFIFRFKPCFRFTQHLSSFLLKSEHGRFRCFLDPSFVIVHKIFREAF